jgi:uncharacterized protein involved in exopolysaccharide biosynthesis
MTVAELESSPEDQPSDGFIGYLPSILWQRRWLLLIPGLLGLVAGVAAAYTVPSTFRSSALLLVESPELASDITGGRATNSIEQRIAKIRQQVLSRPDLIQLIETNGLYAELREAQPLSKLIEEMRSATTIAPVNADVAANQGPSTIAFSLTFDYPDPIKAQVVAQGFVERLMKLDATQTAREAAGTVQFLQDQTDDLAEQVSTLEGQINQIKAANGTALASAGMMMMSGSGGSAPSQIAALQRENAQLSAQLTTLASASDRDPAVVAAEAQLAGARAVYSDNHPDVRLAQQRLVEAKQFATRNIAMQNTAMATIRQQIAANNETIRALSSAESTEQAREIAMRSAQARAPAITEQIAQLQARLDSLRKNYDLSATKLIAAQGAAKLAEQQKNERLSVIEPPVVADSPHWPNRPLLIAGGPVAGLGLGLVLVLLLELLARPIRGVGALQRITGEIPLVVIPTVREPRRRPRLFQPKRRKARRVALTD